MLKKCLLAALLFLLAPGAFAFGHLGDLFLWVNGQSLPNGRYLSYKFVHQEEISFCTEGSPQDWAKPLSAQELSFYFQAAFREWTRGTAQYLRRSGRADEFADIIALLEKPFKLVDLGLCHQNTSKQPDIEIVAVTPAQDEYVGAYYAQIGMRFGSASQIRITSPVYKTEKDLPPRAAAVLQTYMQSLLSASSSKITLEEVIKKLSLGDEKDWDLIKNQGQVYPDALFMIMLHEVGHAFGLLDEVPQQRAGQGYQRGLMGQRPQGQQPTFRTPYYGDGIMSYQSHKQRTADDVMGIITILDRQKGVQRVIYPLLGGKKDLKIGSLVNGQYVYPPVKNSKRAAQLFEKYFSKGDYHISLLSAYGPRVFKSRFSPAPGWSPALSQAPARKAQQQVTRQLINHLQQKQK